MSSRRRRRHCGQFLALSLSLAAAALLVGSIAAAQGADGTESALPATAPSPKTISASGAATSSSPSTSSSDDGAAADSFFCTASTGRELLVALATPACKVITLTGVISVYDADFAGLDRVASARLDGDGGFARATPVMLRSAEGVGVGGASRNGTSSTHDSFSSASSSSSSMAAPRAALEAASRLTLHVDVPKGIAVELRGLSLAGTSVKAPSAAAARDAAKAAANATAKAGARAGAAAAASAADSRAAGAAAAGGGAMFSIFHVHAGAQVALSGCDLRAKRGLCSDNSAPAAAAAGPGGGSGSDGGNGSATPAPSPPPSVGGRVDGALLLAADPSAAFRHAEDGGVVIERATIDPLALFGRIVQRRSSSSSSSPAPSPLPPESRRSPQRRRLRSPSPPAAASASASAASSISASSSARLFIADTALWCPETGFVRAGRPSAPQSEGRGNVSVSSRVWTPLELSSALGSAGSRTVLCEDDLVLPRAGRGRPAALVQDRDVVFRAAADAGGEARRPVRLSCLHEPGARDCVFPVVSAGSGGSVSFEGLSIEAPDPGCPVQPATRCSYRGRALPGTLRGSLTPAGAVGVSGGGWVVFSNVELSYDFCTPEFERAVDVVVAGAAAAAAASNGAGAVADGVTLVRSSGVNNGGSSNGSLLSSPPLMSFSCARCDFDCSLPGSAERGELPGIVSLRNMTITCARPLPASLRKRAGTGFVRAGSGKGDGKGGGKGGGDAGAADGADGALASSSSPDSSSSTSSSHASVRLSASALAATLAAGGAAVAAAALGAALGARTVARRAAAAEAAAVSGSASGGCGSDGGDEHERVRVSSSSSDDFLSQQKRRPWWRRVFTPSPSAVALKPDVATSSVGATSN